jgi:hypothetical protein
MLPISPTYIYIEYYSSLALSCYKHSMPNLDVSCLLAWMLLQSKTSQVQLGELLSWIPMPYLLSLVRLLVPTDRKRVEQYKTTNSLTKDL